MSIHDPIKSTDGQRVPGVNGSFDIQQWDGEKYPEARVWDDVPATRVYTDNIAEYAQKLANESGHALRVTAVNFLPVGRRNGFYYHPTPNTRPDELGVKEMTYHDLYSLAYMGHKIIDTAGMQVGWAELKHRQSQLQRVQVNELEREGHNRVIQLVKWHL